jgi:hypothetical protein
MRMVGIVGINEEAGAAAMGDEKSGLCHADDIGGLRGGGNRAG